MESRGYAILNFFMLCIIPFGIGLLVVLGIRGLPLSKRGIQSVIRMDGANFLKTDEGNIQIRRRTFFIWCMITVFGLIELGLIAVLAADLSRLTKTQDLSDIIRLGTVIPFLGLILFLNIRLLLRQSVIQFDADSRTITIGKGIAEQRILFSQVSEVSRLPRGQIIDIRIILDNGKAIEMGSVSGTKAQARAVGIAQQIAEVTGAKIRDS